MNFEVWNQNDALKVLSNREVNSKKLITMQNFDLIKVALSVTMEPESLSFHWVSICHEQPRIGLHVNRNIQGLMKLNMEDQAFLKSGL